MERFTGAGVEKPEEEKFPVSTETKLEGTVAEQIEAAKEILGSKEVIEPEETGRLWGVELDPGEVPPIPFDRKFLERVRDEYGAFLIFRIDAAADGTPLTMLTMNNLKKEEFAEKELGEVISSQYGHLKQLAEAGSDFFVKETPRRGWALVAKEIVDRSDWFANYYDQTEQIDRELKEKIFKDPESANDRLRAVLEFEDRKRKVTDLIRLDPDRAIEELDKFEITEMPKEYLEALAEFENKKEEIKAHLKSKSEEVIDRGLEELAKLKILDLVRPTPAEVVFDEVSYILKNGKMSWDERGFRRHAKIWTSQQSDDHRFVYIDTSGIGGMEVGRRFRQHNGNTPGLLFSFRK